jgi:hypothetical protein
MEIVIEQSFIHPYLGRGEEMVHWRYAMHSGADAEKMFVELSKTDSDFSRTRIYIAHNPPAKEQVEG